MTQELETATTISAEDEFPINPFADFNHLLRGHLSGAPLPNGKKDLTHLCSLISKKDEQQTMRIIQNASSLRPVDLSKAKTSQKALELLLTD